MARTRSKRNWFRLHPLRTLGIVIFVLGLIYGLRGIYPGEQVGIFAITEPRLTLGETTLAGVLRKDASLGSEGSFYLVLEDSRTVELDASGVDSMLGEQVTAQGFLYPPTEELKYPYMIVGDLRTNE